MRIALTGATGYLGRHLVSHLVAAGHELRCWLRDESSFTGLERYRTAVDWIHGQIGDVASACNLVRGMDALVHAAVDWGNRPIKGLLNPENQDNLFGYNLAGSLQLFQVAKRYDVRRMVLISCSAVYGDTVPNQPRDETHAVKPTTHFGAYKAALEAYVHSCGLGGRWPICALRPSTIYGLSYHHQFSHWFKLVGRAWRNELEATADGGDVVNAQDVVRAVELLLRTDPQVTTGQVYNCSDLFVTDQDVARLVREIMSGKQMKAGVDTLRKGFFDSQKLQQLGMRFWGEEMVRNAVRQLLDVHGAFFASKR